MIQYGNKINQTKNLPKLTHHFITNTLPATITLTLASGLEQPENEVMKRLSTRLQVSLFLRLVFWLNSTACSFIRISPLYAKKLTAKCDLNNSDIWYVVSNNTTEIHSWELMIRDLSLWSITEPKNSERWLKPSLRHQQLLKASSWPLVLRRGS